MSEIEKRNTEIRKRMAQRIQAASLEVLMEQGFHIVEPDTANLQFHTLRLDPHSCGCPGKYEEKILYEKHPDQESYKNAKKRFKKFPFVLLAE